MRGPYTQSSPLTEWLAKCEGELPLPAQEALQAERAAPTAGKLQHGLATAIQGLRYAVQVEEVRGMSPNPHNGHTQRLLSLSGYGAGDWLNVVPLHCSLHLEAPHFANALQFRLGLPFAAPGVCNCTKKVEEKKADLALRCRSTGAVYICDVTVTDPISTRDENATKGRGWAAREAADKKHGLYKDRPEWVRFFPLAVETYGCPCPETVDFLKLLSETAARRFFNAEPTSYQAAKLLHHFRLRWSVALQRGQSIGYLEKCSIAAAVENPLLEAVGEAPSLGDCLSGHGANAPPTTAFLKLLATAAARNRFRANPLAKTAKKMACHFSQRRSVALQRSQANALHTKARAGIEAAHPQMAADPWPLHLGDILHTLEG
ncbi:unnamed protein product [Closterium sp. NIES-53]